MPGIWILHRAVVRLNIHMFHVLYSFLEWHKVKTGSLPSISSLYINNACNIFLVCFGLIRFNGSAPGFPSAPAQSRPAVHIYALALCNMTGLCPVWRHFARLFPFTVKYLATNFAFPPGKRKNLQVIFHLMYEGTL